MLSHVQLFVIPWNVACQAPVYGIFQTRILEWVAIPLSRGSLRPRDWTWVSHISGRFFTIWATREAQSAIKWRTIKQDKPVDTIDCTKKNSIKQDSPGYVRLSTSRISKKKIEKSLLNLTVWSTFLMLMRAVLIRWQGWTHD